MPAGRRSQSAATVLLLLPQFFEERFALTTQFFFELARAIAVATSPRFGSILVPAIASGVRVLHANELKIFRPIRTLFGERRIAKAGPDPSGDAGIDPRLLHIIKVIVAGDCAAA